MVAVYSSCPSSFVFSNSWSFYLYVFFIYMLYQWTFKYNSQARQSLIVRGLFPMLADPRHPVSSIISIFWFFCCSLVRLLTFNWVYVPILVHLFHFIYKWRFFLLVTLKILQVHLADNIRNKKGQPCFDLSFDGIFTYIILVLMENSATFSTYIQKWRKELKVHL